MACKLGRTCYNVQLLDRMQLCTMLMSGLWEKLASFGQIVFGQCPKLISMGLGHGHEQSSMAFIIRFRQSRLEHYAAVALVKTYKDAESKLTLIGPLAQH